eukprot:TRINITY_DN2420_c1_g1_i1.p1 TRINITY_DN2420_c1_g1~~TRINITY_DN2420_c1_g1_i1.p1  ORF type:complete len:710 (+),score=146.23 TRINITY_DN2420_c1_g1_i1:31-2160(+)
MNRTWNLHFYLCCFVTAAVIVAATEKFEEVDNILFANDATDHLKDELCHISTQILWQVHLDSEIYSTPLIVDSIYGDGKEVKVSSLNHVYSLEGRDGDIIQGWPFSIRVSDILSSPLLYDIDNSGLLDTVIPTLSGEIVFLTSFGRLHHGKTLIVPPKYIIKDWKNGVDHTPKVNHKVPKNIQNTHRILNENKTNVEDYWKLFTDIPLTTEGKNSFELFFPVSSDVWTTDENIKYSVQYDNYFDELQNKEGYIPVPAHILSTPVIADIDNDGYDDLIVSVSYYFSETVEMPDDTINKYDYVVSGVVAFDLHKGLLKWSTTLDVTTDTATYKAYTYGDPTVIDIDGDGELEIIVGDGVGMIYILSSKGSRIDLPTPITLDSIYSTIVVEDVNDDGELNIVVTDGSGAIVCFDIKGQELWENSLSGYTSITPVIADINGNGELDILAITHSGYIWAFNGKTGRVLSGYPIKLGGEVNSAPALIRMEKNLGHLHIITHAMDGHIYIIDGTSGCPEVIDIGEDSYSQVLVDDITGNDKFDILVSTHQGTIYCIGTEVPFDPFFAWSSTLNGRNSFTYGVQGVKFTDSTLKNRDIVGSSMKLSFEIMDIRNSDTVKYYDIKIFEGKKVIHDSKYNKPGVYTIDVQLPKRMTKTTYRIEMENEHKQAFFGEFSAVINQSLFKPMKWIMIIPLLILLLSVTIYKLEKGESVLPVIE